MASILLEAYHDAINIPDCDDFLRIYLAAAEFSATDVFEMVYLPGGSRMSIFDSNIIKKGSNCVSCCYWGARAIGQPTLHAFSVSHG